MEIKKNKNVDLEKGRLQTYLISLIVVLSALFVVLEYDFSAEADDDEEELMDDEFELAPLKREEERIALAIKEPPKPAADKIKVVEKKNASVELIEEKGETHEGKGNSVEDSKEEEKKDNPLMANADNALDNNPLNFRVVEELPQFPGGAMAMMKWLTANLKYPPSAQKRKVQGKVMVQFIVAADGTMTDLKIVKSLDKSCDNEALRVMRLMPKWKPGVQYGKPCRTMVCIPIVFKL